MVRIFKLLVEGKESIKSFVYLAVNPFVKQINNLLNVFHCIFLWLYKNTFFFRIYEVTLLFLASEFILLYLIRVKFKFKHRLIALLAI